MNQMAYVFQIWLPLVIWQQVSAPKYTAGFATVLWLSVGMLIMTVFTMYFHRREKMRYVEVLLPFAFGR
jgi:ACS family pantothenate transporter-like MFS transporter